MAKSDHKGELPHLEVNPLDEKKKASLKNRIIVAVVLFIICIPCLILGGWFWFGLIVAVLALSTYEMIKAPQKKYRWYIWAFTYFLVISFALWVGLKTWVGDAIDASEKGVAFVFNLEHMFSSMHLSVYALAISFAFYALCAILREDFSWQDVLYFFAMTFVLGIAFQSFLYLRYCPFNADWGTGIVTTSAGFRYGQSFLLILMVIAGTYLNDAFAYFVGMFLGHHKINPRISPNKTWEGFVGGIVLSAIVTYGVVLILDANGLSLLPGMRIFGEGGQWWWTFIMCLGIPLIGNLGDFTYSMIKRYYGFKDYSHILGAHGGFLDRIDSLTFTMVFASIFTFFTMNGWHFFA